MGVLVDKGLGLDPVMWDGAEEGGLPARVGLEQHPWSSYGPFYSGDLRLWPGLGNPDSQLHHVSPGLGVLICEQSINHSGPCSLSGMLEGKERE